MGRADYYSILGVSTTCTADQVKRAYRALAKRFHPDTNPSADAAEKFARVAEAYETLGNSEKRRAFDRARAGKGPRSTASGSGRQGHYSWTNVASPAADGPADVSEIDELYDTFFVPHAEKAGVRPEAKRRRPARGS